MNILSVLGAKLNPSFVLLNKFRLGFLLLNALFGIFFSKGLNPLKYYCYGLIVIGTFKIINTRNRAGIAHNITAYVIGLEVFLRAIGTNIPWQYSKYCLIGFLLLGYYFEKRKNMINQYYLFYLILLFPSIFVINSNDISWPTHQIVLAALSGPATLFASSIYFNKKQLSFEEFQIMVFYLFCGLTPCLLLLSKNLVSLQSIEFTESSNFATSAGFGPNQISTTLGVGILFMYIINVFEFKIFWRKYIDIFIWILFIILGILTFSRGGVFSAIISIFFSIIYSQFKQKTKKLFVRSFLISSITLFILSQSIVYLNDFSQGMLYDRYFINQNEDTTKYLTGRDVIFFADLNMFLDNILFGVGPGMGLVKRADYGLSGQVTAHNEFTRLVAEHGIFGLIALCIITFYPLYHFKKIKFFEVKLFFICTITYSIFTMGHSSMRLALVGFLYGVSFINIYFILPQTKIKSKF